VTRPPWELPAGFEGRYRTASRIADRESAMRSWVAEVGRELRDVERQIRFFRQRVEARIYPEGTRPGPVGETCRRCGKT
jgi:type VI protein secretion system component VasF